jgi:hypothetical protein
VCHIVDELLNLELYRREFKFAAPIIPEDENFGEDEGDEPETEGE